MLAHHAQVKVERPDLQQDNILTGKHVPSYCAAAPALKAEQENIDRAESMLPEDRLSLEMEFQEMNFDCIKKESDMSAHHHQLPTLQGTDIRVIKIFRSRKKIKSVEDLSNFLQICQTIAPSSNIAKFLGPIRLAECPACTFQRKNSPDRLIQLFDHIIKRHHSKRRILLKNVLDDYYPLICFMKKMWIAKP